MTEDPNERRGATDSAALAARLERLHQRRTPAGAPGPEPVAVAPAARRTRRHPARTARCAAVGLSVLSTAGLTSLFVSEASGSTPAGTATVVSGGSAPTTAAAGSSSAAAPAAQGGSSATAAPSVVDGAVSRNRWGNVQVEATFAADGSLTDVQALQVPGGRGTSVEINDYAVPQLNADALDLQSAQVHTISGATYTSDSYRTSLQSAIDAARAAGITNLA